MKRFLQKIGEITNSGSRYFTDLLRFFNQYYENPKRQQNHITRNDQTTKEN